MSIIDEVIGERYRTVRLIGRGGTADVFEARDERTGAAVAVKIVRSNDPEFAHRLVEEARALESLDLSFRTLVDQYLANYEDADFVAA